jgi:hypothetical protein
MNATAERLLAEIKALPPSDINELCESVTHLANSVTVTPRPPQDKALNAIRTSYGLFAGAGLTQKLLDERASERAREEAQAELHRTRRG